MEIIKREYTASYSKEVVFTLDTEAKFSRLNYAWTILTGYAINESYQKPLTSFIESIEDIQHIKEFIHNDNLDELNIELNIKTITFNKQVEACFYKTYDQNSQASIFGVLIDMSKYKESRRRLIKQLAFEHQNKKEFNELLNLFSHDLSSAQAAVFSSVELLEMISLPTKQAIVEKRRHYSNIKAQTQNINILLDDFLFKWRKIYLKENEKINGDEL